MKWWMSVGLATAAVAIGAQSPAIAQPKASATEQSAQWGKWVYLQSDKAVQYRVAKIGQEGDIALLRYQLRVEPGNTIACYSSRCEGYVVYLPVWDPVASAIVATHHLFFPAGTRAIYDLPETIRFPIRTSPTGRRFLSPDTGLPMYELFSAPGDYRVTEVLQGCVDDKITGYPDIRCREFDFGSMVTVREGDRSTAVASDDESSVGGKTGDGGVSDTTDANSPAPDPSGGTDGDGGASKARPGSAATGAADEVPEYERRYQQELAIYNQQLAERAARIREIEQAKADQAAKLARDHAEARQALERHEREMRLHQEEVERAEAARRRYEQELAAHEAQVNRDQLVDWREAVVVCTLKPEDGQSKFGNWRCDGPLQFTYAKLGESGGIATGGALVALSQACGGRPESVRDLGSVSGYRVFGCGFGLHPKNTSGLLIDAASKYGLDYVPGRAVYRCPASKSACRAQ